MELEEAKTANWNFSEVKSSTILSRADNNRDEWKVFALAPGMASQKRQDDRD